jgi:hypothetical protein
MNMELPLYLSNHGMQNMCESATNSIWATYDRNYHTDKTRGKN